MLSIIIYSDLMLILSALSKIFKANLNTKIIYN